jgi:hypothetical protein
MAGEIGGDDGDETRGQSALRDEGGLGAIRQRLDLAGAGDVLGEKDIVRPILI